LVYFVGQCVGLDNSALLNLCWLCIYKEWITNAYIVKWLRAS